MTAYLKNFRWAHGMRTLPDRLGRAFRYCEYEGSEKKGTFEQVQGSVYRCPPDYEDLEPDLADPATLGALLGLVREAWGDPNAFVDPRGGWHCCVSSKGPLHGHDMEFDGDTEGDALTSALMEAP